MSATTEMPKPLGMSEQGRTMLCIVGGPYVLHEGGRVDIPDGSKRLLVFVALHGGRVDRRYAAGALWPNGDDERASGNLRSALWRLKAAGIDVVLADKSGLYLRRDTYVDVTAICDWADRVIMGGVSPSDLRVSPTTLEAVDLLPGWYDDWVILERERLRQRLLHALEALSRRLVVMRHWGQAVEAAMAAVNVEPLRESAQRVLVEAHLAEGNLVEARRCVSHYRVILHDELGVPPSDTLLSMVGVG